MKRNLVLVVLSLASLSVLAQPRTDSEICAGSAGTADERIAACTRAIVSGRLENADLSVAFYNRAIGWRSMGDNDRAIADYNEAIRLNPQYGKAYNNRGGAWRAKGDNDRAIADYNEAIRLNPQYAAAYSNRAQTWDAKVEFSRATADFNEAIRLGPKAADTYNAFAWRLATFPDERARNGKRAILIAKQACELTSWNVANYLNTLAAAYAEAGEFAEAIRWQEKALGFADYAVANGAKAKERLILYRSGKAYRQ
jgi:tetratricopeptide (TPR) repeat protein